MFARSLRLSTNIVSKRLPFGGNMRCFASEIERMSVKTFQTIVEDPIIRKEYQIIDVREPDELLVSAIPGDDIINLPLSSASEWTRQIADGDILDKSMPTLCLCRYVDHSCTSTYYISDYSIVLLISCLYSNLPPLTLFPKTWSAFHEVS